MPALTFSMLRKARTFNQIRKGGDHDQKEHGNWADGGGPREFDGVRVAGGGLWVDSNKTYGRNPPKGKILAAYTDDNGYTIRIVGGAGPAGGFRPRTGLMSITSPDGERRRAGFWMGWPEDEWKVSSKSWRRMSWEDKAAMEVKHQATAYAGLKSDFEFYSKSTGSAAKSFSELRKGGDHDQSEHGNWADGGGGQQSISTAEIKRAAKLANNPNAKMYENTFSIYRRGAGGSKERWLMRDPKTNLILGSVNQEGKKFRATVSGLMTAKKPSVKEAWDAAKAGQFEGRMDINTGRLKKHGSLRTK